MKILFVDKVMAGKCQGPPRGVELFNVQLLRELVAAGEAVTALLHPSWLEYVDAVGLTVLPGGGVAGGDLGAFRQMRYVLGKSYDLLLQGNVANRLVPLVVGLRLLRVCGNCVVIAHREPSRRVLGAQRAWPDSVIVAVNRVIAGHFLREGFENTSVYYGITGADRFRPRCEEKADGVVHFCVAGNLDNGWKGADTAVAAFRQLPAGVGARCRLHLASFHQVPEYPEDNIRAYAWMAADAMPGFLAGMDVLLVPSRDEAVMRETFSQVMVQGMLSGLPVITTRLPILMEKIDTGGGIVAESVADMAQAMEGLAGDAERRRQMGHHARETALSRYVWDTEYFVRHFLQMAKQKGAVLS